MGRMLSEQDATFVMQARPMGLAEIKMSELAADYASNPQLKQLAQRIVQDHASANRMLLQMVRGSDLDLPDEVDAAHEKLIDKLWSLEGSEFDRTYAQAQVRDHERAVALFEREAQSGRDPALKEYAQRYLPMLQAHLDRVRAVARSLEH